MIEPFEKTSNEIAQDLYPYTVITYTMGLRGYKECRSLSEVYELFQREDAGEFSIGGVISPNGKYFTDDEFVKVARKYGGAWNEMHSWVD